MLQNVFYINLENRKDRKEQVEQELNDLGWDFSRFNAIKTKNGRVGCSMSHLKLLQTAKQQNLDYIVIVEDDIQFMRKQWLNSKLKEIMNSDFKFDVFLLGGNIRPPIFKITNHIFKIKKSFTTTGYIVKNHYYDTLIKNVKEGIQHLIKNPGGQYNDNAIDVYWMKLQERDNWLILLPRTITQRPIYSDIEKRFTDYNHLMLDDLSKLPVDTINLHHQKPMLNICHFVFGMKQQTEEFLFCYYIAVYSAYVVNNPDIINFYYHYLPYGTWWEKLKLIPNIKLEKIDIPTHIGKKKIQKTAHKADWVRMNMLYNKGGVYLDIDTVCVKPWKHLFNEDVVLGKEVPNGICNAIMFTKPKSEFFKLWLDEYESHFNQNGWREASIVLPEILSKQFPHLVTVKNPDVFFLPNYTETQKIFVDNKAIPNTLISLHLWETFSLKYMKNINGWSWAYENSHTMYGKMLLNLIDRKKNLPKLHIIHRIDKTNTGDMVSNCSEYYSFEDYTIVKHDIYSPDFAIIKKNDPIILSGGGLLNCLEIWNKNINKLLELSENVFGWGIGYNKHHNTNISTKINLSKFKLLGIRDYKPSYESNTRYVPCSSCNLQELKYEYKIQRNVGVIEHHHNKILLKEKYDKINNEVNIVDLITFIGESNIIITNTYHALYFASLLNKKCILYNSFSEKFNFTKFEYVKYTKNLVLNDIKNMNKDLLQNSIKINNVFYSDVKSIIN